MREILKKYSREELEKKLIHMTSFIAYKIACEYIELTDPLAKIIRTKEAEEENAQRVLEHIVCVFPAWKIVEETHPGYDSMTKWVEENHKKALIKPCICEGCETE
jgi:hypothetical protein